MFRLMRLSLICLVAILSLAAALPAEENPGYPGTRPPAGGVQPHATSQLPSATAARGNLYDRGDPKASVADRGTTGRQPGPAGADRANDVFAGPDGNARQRGNSRTNSYNQSRSMPYGGARGRVGGGRRR